MTMSQENTLRKLFGAADIEINGSRDWDIQVRNPAFYTEVFSGGSLGFGESYIRGEWDVGNLDQMFTKIFASNLEKKIPKTISLFSNIIFAKVKNHQSRRRSIQVADAHYNLSKELYSAMLGSSMAYTCGYWKEAKDLDSAQYAKYDLICKKLHLQEGDEVLEHGCGWGGFAKYAAENYKARITCVNISAEQVKYARDLTKDLDVKIFECDYRDFRTYNPDNIQFDKIVSIGMAEHVGYKNYNQWFQIIHKQMKPDALFLLHSIFSDTSRISCDPFTHKYIFPNSVVPSVKQISSAAEGLFVFEDLHNFGKYYYPTVKEWYNNFIAYCNNKGKDQVSESFFRMWSFYLGACMGIANSRESHLYQIVFSKLGSQRLYDGIR